MMPRELPQDSVETLCIQWNELQERWLAVWSVREIRIGDLEYFLVHTETLLGRLRKAKIEKPHHQLLQAILSIQKELIDVLGRQFGEIGQEVSTVNEQIARLRKFHFRPPALRGSTLSISQ